MTTPNFGWPLIQPTDLVTDLPADFETFADAVDADLDGLNGGTIGQVLTKASATDYDFAFATPAGLPITTEGDLIVGDATGVPVRLPVGAAGEVLTSDGDTVLFIAPSAPSKVFTLLNTGGTTLSGTSTTISGISNQDSLHIFVSFAGHNTSATSIYGIQLNSSITNYQFGLGFVSGASAYDAGSVGSLRSDSTTSLRFAKTSDGATSRVSGYARLDGCATTGIKTYHWASGATTGGGNGHEFQSGGGATSSLSTVTSVTLLTTAGSFDAGTIFIYGAS